MKLHSYFVLLILIANPAAAEPCFPGKEFLDSPTGEYSIDWQEPTDGETHHLFFRTRSDLKSRKPLLDFGRSVCIYWAPTEQHFALTWHAGSNVSETYIYSSVDITQRILVNDVLPETILDEMKGYFHIYVVATGWSERGLNISIKGYGRDDGIDKVLSTTVVCRFAKAEWQCDA